MSSTAPASGSGSGRNPKAPKHCIYHPLSTTHDTSECRSGARSAVKKQAKEEEEKKQDRFIRGLLFAAIDRQAALLAANDPGQAAPNAPNAVDSPGQAGSEAPNAAKNEPPPQDAPNPSDDKE